MKALGIDLGTTKVAAVIYDDKNGLLAAESMAHNAAINNIDPAIFEQDTNKIISCTEELISKLPPTERSSISAIGITGQMHSLLMIRNDQPGNLVTWQDQRCGAELLNEFNRRSGLALREGFGGTTLAGYAASGELSSADCCATISDYLAAKLTGSEKIVTDPTHAASWGIYNSQSNSWQFDALKKLDIPVSILPEIRPCGANLGNISIEYSKRFNIPACAVVINAIGDNQASILGTGKDLADEIYLTLGTGAQLSMVVNDYKGVLPENIELRPFPDNRSLLVSAPLCGGAAFAMLADTVNKFRAALGEAVLDRGKLLDKLDLLAMEYIKSHDIMDIEIAPHFLGERYNPDLRGTISGLTLDNATPGALAAALAFGIVRNLKRNFPVEELTNRKAVIGSGNAVRLLQCIQYAIEQEFALPLKLASGKEEAACGAAIQALISIQQ